MIRENTSASDSAAGTSALRPLDRALRRLVDAGLSHLQHGRITICDEDGARTYGDGHAAAALHSTVRIHDGAFYRLLATRGILGAAEAYMDGMWDCDDLTTAVRIVARDQAVMEGMDSGLARLTRPLLRLFALSRRNTLGGSRRNIADHYDLGNDLFEQFLDPTMTYSSAIFETPQSTLEQAQIAKYDRICRKLGIGADDHVLEIGTGWGGFAIHAAGRYGCRVTTTTISARQLELARRRVREAGLEDRIELLSKDYRELDGTYDKLVSIEMIEAVGHQYMEEFFRICAQRLRPDGRALIQAIVNPDRVHESSLDSVEFIKRYIFPGGSLPSIWSMCDAARKATDLRLVHLEDITLHYAATLAHWRRRFLERRERIASLGYSERFLRMWEFYLCYCEGGFRERTVNTVQVVLERQDCRRPMPMPALAAAEVR